MATKPDKLPLAHQYYGCEVAALRGQLPVAEAVCR